MKQELVSIVIPIYKVEKYLNRCLNSVVNQTYQNLEIILVDDGSPDKCPRMCDEWAQRDDRIKVIHKKNQGLGMARNTGIENATGEYICFFDSDDYISLDTIEKSYKSIKKNNADIVMFGMYSVDEKGMVVSENIPRTEKELYSGEEILNFILPNMIAADPVTGKKLGMNMSSSGRMYSLELIKNIGWRFVSEREYISEDFYSLLVLYKDVKRVAIIQEAFYYYCYNETSLTHTFDSNKYRRVCICHEGMIQVAQKYRYPKIVSVCLDSQYIGSVIGVMKLIVTSSLMYKEKIKAIKKIIQDNYLQNVLINMDIKNESVARKIIINTMKKKKAISTYCLVKMKS